jgi:TIR domain-containing protein
MKELSIYIDFAGSSDKEINFIKTLKSRLINIKGISNVQSYIDINDDEDEDEDDTWEKVTATAIDAADIVIPILSERYLSYVSDEIETRFIEIIDSKHKFLFPILYTPSEWGGNNWVVRSKLMPQNGKALSTYSDNEVEGIINELIKTIKNILIRLSSDKKTSEQQEINGVLPDKNTIFISHDHDDADFAELLKLKLEKSGLASWIDTERLKIGQDWREEIDQGIENSLAVIAIMTPDARKSEYVTYEWSFAWGKGKKVFPILLKQTQLHPRLESLQYLDFTIRASRPWDELIESIQELME